MHIFSQLKESARILHHIDFRCWRKINFEFSKLQIQKLHEVLDDIFNNNPLKPKLRQRLLRHLISVMRRRNKNWHNKRQNNDKICYENTHKERLFMIFPNLKNTIFETLSIKKSLLKCINWNSKDDPVLGASAQLPCTFHKTHWIRLKR